jgi:hypothetical protein
MRNVYWEKGPQIYIHLIITIYSYGVVKSADPTFFQGREEEVVMNDFYNNNCH